MSTTVPSAPIDVNREEEEEAKIEKQVNENENHAAKAPPPYSSVALLPIPAASDCRPHFDQQQNIHAKNEQQNFGAADGQLPQKIYSIPLATKNANAVPSAGAAAGAVGEIMSPSSHPQQQHVVYAAPIMQPKFEMPPQQQSMQIINLTNMVASANANCVHKFESTVDGCGVLCICLGVILLFPIGLIFLLCIPFAMKKRCIKCGHQC